MPALDHCLSGLAKLQWLSGSLWDRVEIRRSINSVIDFCSPDDVIIIEDELTDEDVYGAPRTDRYEIRLVGWEEK